MGGKFNKGQPNKQSKVLFFNCCNETIKHLFFDCHHAKTIWRSVPIATELTPPSLGSWLSNFDLKEKKYIMVQVAALCWTIWRCRNDLIFKNCKYIMVQVVALLLQHDDETIESFRLVSRKLETTALKLFTFHGWKFNNTRLCTIFVFLVFLIHQQIPLKLCN